MFQEVLIISDPQVFWNEKIVFDDPKEYHDPWVSDVLTVISNEGMDSNDPKEFDDPQIFDDPISIGSMVGFDNSKAYGDTSILDGLVFIIIKYDGCLEDIDFMDFGTLHLIEKIFLW